MSTVTINGKTYKIPELDFNAVCELEENGICLLNMDRKDRKIATMIRGLVAWIMGTDVETASEEIQNHISGGGDIGEVMTKVTQAINESSFFKRRGTSEEEETVTEFPQNREQRRKAEKQKSTTH